MKSLYARISKGFRRECGTAFDKYYVLNIAALSIVTSVPLSFFY